jgi:hypothetical protein
MPGHVDTDPSDGFNGLSFPRSFRFLARAGLEKRNVTGHRFDQVMNEGHFKSPLEVDLDFASVAGKGGARNFFRVLSPGRDSKGENR